MAAALALVAALLFALAATLQQKGALNLPTISLAHPMSLLRLVGQRTWLIGTLVLLAGYLVPGRSARPRPPLGHPAAARHDRRLRAPARLPPDQPARGPAGGARARSRSSSGSACSSTSATRPAGTRTRPTPSGRSRSACSSLLCVLLLVLRERRPFEEGGRVRHRRRHPLRALVVPGDADARLSPRERGHDAVPLGVLRARGHRRARLRLSAGSLGTGRLAPAVATVSVANPVVAILIGVVLLDERLSRPAWHVLVAVIGLALTFVGAVVISLAREAASERPTTRRAPPPRRLAAMAEAGRAIRAEP